MSCLLHALTMQATKLNLAFAVTHEARIQGRPLRVAFLVGGDHASTRASIEAVCRIEGIDPVGILRDTAQPSSKTRRRNLLRNIRREGASYIYHRFLRSLREWVKRRASEAAAPGQEVEALLRKAFPERCFSLEDLERRYGCPVYEVGNLNQAEAVACLKKTGADLGVVIGTRVLKRAVFSVPKLGCINLHKGGVPDYRGMPPGFWEIYDQAEAAGVTVHFVDEGLDTGDVIGTATIPIHPLETVASLASKLDREGARLLAESVARLKEGSAERQPQPKGGPAPRTKPTRLNLEELARRSPRLREWESDTRRLFKSLLYLFLFRSGALKLLRAFRRAPLGRGAIILYHRVNDVSAHDALTTSVGTFAEHLVMLLRYYRVKSASDIVDRVCAGKSIEAGAVAIHFDDCYQDVYSEGAQLLKAAGLPAAMFIATGFVNTDRVFEHDRMKSPHRFPNLRAHEIPALLECGFEVGAHTVHHVDLGNIDLEQAVREVRESKVDLENFSGGPVTLFSFPFGRGHHIREEVRSMVRDAGYRALFSAYGGFVSGASDPFDIPRLGVNSQFDALDLMMEIEGVSVAQIFSRAKQVQAGA